MKTLIVDKDWNHGWTLIDTDVPGKYFFSALDSFRSAFIGVHPRFHLLEATASGEKRRRDARTAKPCGTPEVSDER